MLYRTATVILCAALLAGCGSTSRIFQRTPTEPQIVTVVETKYVRLPPELLKRCPATHGQNRAVGEYVRVANTNTPRLVACDKQIEEINKLQPK